MIDSTLSNIQPDTRYLRHQPPTNADDSVRLAEEGQSSAKPGQYADSKPMSRARVFTLVAIVIAKAVIVVLSAYGAYLVGRARMPCMKGIIFAATAMMATTTVIAMLIARRALSEILLAGLIEFVFGFALVAELDDFI